MTVGAPRMLQHVAYHGQIKPGGAQPPPSLVWVRSFLLLDELPAKDKEPHLPEPDIPQVTQTLKRTQPVVGKTLYSYRPPGGLSMGQPRTHRKRSCSHMPMH